MLCVPGFSVDVVKVASPLEFTAADDSAVVPSRKVMVPANAPLFNGELTVAVITRLWFRFAPYGVALLPLMARVTMVCETVKFALALLGVKFELAQELPDVAPA